MNVTRVLNVIWTDLSHYDIRQCLKAQGINVGNSIVKKFFLSMAIKNVKFNDA